MIKSPDGKIRSASVRVLSKTGRSIVLKRPVQHLHPLEADFKEIPRDNQPKKTSELVGDSSTLPTLQTDPPDRGAGESQGG